MAMGELRAFVADLLESEGAAIEPVEPEGLDVLSSEPVRAAMGWPEFIRLGFGITLPPGAVPIGLEGDWLDRLGSLLGERGRYAERQLSATATAPVPNDPQRMLDHALDLPNAAWRLRDARPTWTRLALLCFRYTAIADEQREGLIWIGFNQGTGGIVDGDFLRRLWQLLAGEDWYPPDPDVCGAAGPGWDATLLAARLEPLLGHHVRRDLQAFLNASRRRLERDRKRIYDYYDDLRRSAQIRLAALGSAAGERAEADRQRETMRIAAIEREYAAKLDDLRHNYAVRVTVNWMQGLTLFAPVHRFEVLIKRRKGERIIGIDWHPAIRMLEPPPCDWGAGVGRTRLVCDDHLHLTDESGQAACQSCGKAWCRACHSAACPRCGTAS